MKLNPLWVFGILGIGVRERERDAFGVWFADTFKQSSWLLFPLVILFRAFYMLKGNGQE